MKNKIVAALAIGVIVFAALPHQFLTVPLPTSAEIDSNAAASSTSDSPHFFVFNDEENDDEDDDESDDDNGDDEEEEEDDEGDLEANESEDEFYIGSDDNSIEFEKDAPGLSYEWSNAQREASFEMEEYALVEFLDNNQNQLYDAGDEILFTTGERDDEDHEIDAATEDSVWTFNVSVGRDENDTIQNITVTYRFNDSNHEVLFRMFVDRKSGADEIKIDVIIDTWTWENETSTLALIGKLEAEMESEAYKGTYNASITKDSQGIYLSREVFKVLSHPIRRDIIHLLGNQGAASFTKLSKLEAEPGKLYYHLKQLDDYITQDQEKRYTLNDAGERLYTMLDMGSGIRERGLPSIRYLLTHVFRRVDPLSRYLLVGICIGFLLYLTQHWHVTLLGYYWLLHTPLASWQLSLATVLGVPLFSLGLTKTLFTLEPPHISAVLFTSVISLLPTAFAAFLTAFFAVPSTIFLILLGIVQFIGIEINASGISAITKMSLKKTISIPLFIHFLFSLPLLLLL